MMSASKPAIVIRLRVLIWSCCCVRGFDLAGTGTVSVFEGKADIDIEDERSLEALAKKFKVSKSMLQYRIRNLLSRNA